MSSYDHVALIKKRSQTLMKYAQEAYQNGDYDLACFLAEQAAQLRLKAFILRTLGYTPRTHNIRELLGTLLKALTNLDTQEAEKIKTFASDNREQLRLLEDAYTGSRYLPRSYTKEEAQQCIKTAQNILNLADEIEEKIFQRRPLH